MLKLKILHILHSQNIIYKLNAKNEHSLLQTTDFSKSLDDIRLNMFVYTIKKL